MADVATGGDALRVKNDTGTEAFRSLAAVGTVPGVVPLAVAGRCGPGPAAIRSREDGKRLSFRAPGSAQWGEEVVVEGDGERLLEDGDPDQWLRISVAAAHLIPGPFASVIALDDRYGALGVEVPDVTAAQATAGDDTFWRVSVFNDSPMDVLDARVWLDPDASGTPLFELGWSFGVWSSATSEAAALVHERIAAGTGKFLFIRRNVPALTPPDPRRLLHVHLSWDGF